MKPALKINCVSALIFSLIWLNSLTLHSQLISEGKEIRFKGDGTSGPFFISEGFIFINSEEVWRDNVVLEKDKDYIIDYNKGVVWFNQPLNKDELISINFEELSSGIKKRYFHRELTLSQSTSNSNTSFSQQKSSYSFQNPISQVQKEKSLSPNLQISGSKSFSLDLGSSEALSFSQGLDLKVSGNLAENVKVLALVSDRGSGVIQTGTTKKLEELDKMRMQVESPNFRGFLGDQYLSFDGDLSGRYDKKLQGLSSEIKFDQKSFSVSYASSKGKYCYNSFSGVEGKQGPYYLKGEEGKSGIQVLPATEKVYLDGKLLEKGSDNDYTIDYVRGVLNFSSGCLITGDSRIKVEFEYSDHSFEKSFYSSKGEINFFEGKLKLKGLFLDEREVKDNPLSLALSSEDKTILKNSGEDRNKAFKDGAEYAGAGKGNYIMLRDSLGNSYYQYAGKDSGDYLVSFSWVGDTKGSYVYKGGGIYSYVYPDNGDYLPRIYLPLPSSHSLLDLSLNLIPFEGFLTEFGWGLSRKDRNLFSDLGDEDNSGNALFIRTELEKQNLSFLGHNLSKLKLEGLYRNLGENFLPFGRLDEIEKERVWGMVYDSTTSSEKVFRFKSHFSPLPHLSLNTDLGILKKGGNFESRRNKFGVTFYPLKSLEAKVLTEGINSLHKGELFDQKGNWQRRNLQLAHWWKKLNTQLGWETEKQEFSPQDSVRVNKRFDEFKGNINLESSKLWALYSQFILRKEMRKNTSWKEESDSYTWKNQLRFRNYKEVLSSNLEFIHRQQNLKTGENSKGNIGIFKLDYYPKNQALVLNLNYSVNLLGSEKRVDNYVEVGEGEGDYRFENGEYLPDAAGNFILQKEILAQYVPGKKLERSFRTVFKPVNLFPQVKLLKEFYTESSIKTSNLISKGADWIKFLLNPFSQGFSKNDLFKDFSSSQKFYLFPSAPLNLRLRWTCDKRENLLLLAGKDLDHKKSQSVLLRYRFSYKNLLESELIKDKREREKVNSHSLLLQGESIRINFTRRERNSLEVTLSSRLRKEREKESDLEVILVEFSPKLSYSLLGKSKIHSELSWCKVTVSSPTKILPWEMAEGKKAGDNLSWSLGFDFKLNQTLSANLNYSGLKEAVRGTRHRGKFELRAYF